MDEQKESCMAYFLELAERLKETHEVVASCNKDESLYLIPKGTINQLSYHGKPANSYRYSDHWNWYSNLKKCADPNYVQCHNVDLPGPNKRHKPWSGSTPVYGVCVAYFDKDLKYHTVFE